jgi:hypothetical protein
MNIDEKLVPILNKIKFADRYLFLCEKYIDFNNRLISVDVSKIKETMSLLNLNFKYKKNENFFMLKETIFNYQFQFNIIIQRGVIQLVFDLKQNGERLKLGWGMWENIVENLISEEFYIKPRPRFGNYDDLKEILKEAFSIYEDFKKELLKQSET